MKVDVDVHGCAPRAAAGIWVTAIVPYSWIACHLVGKKKNRGNVRETRGFYDSRTQDFRIESGKWENRADARDEENVDALCDRPRGSSRDEERTRRSVKTRSALRFLDDRPKKAKADRLETSAAAARERKRRRQPGEQKKASARVFRSLNVTRTALPRSSDSRARAAAHYATPSLLLLNRVRSIGVGAR